MEQDDKIIYKSKFNNFDKEKVDFFKLLDEYDKINVGVDPIIYDNYIAYGYKKSKKAKKIDFLVTTSKLKEVIWYIVYQIPIQISKNMEWIVLERRNQFIIEIYDNEELIVDCCIRKLTREGNYLLSMLKGDTKIIASPYSQNLKFINFLTSISVEVTGVASKK